MIGAPAGTVGTPGVPTPRHEAARGGDPVLLDVSGLDVRVAGEHGPVSVLDEVSFSIHEGEALGTVPHVV